ncbi:MAG: hypothetical protein JWQ40_2100 [Segetibacter sp.]|nr:hypothetical protein [Segetibacter sp.]
MIVVIPMKGLRPFGWLTVPLEGFEIKTLRQAMLINCKLSCCCIESNDNALSTKAGIKNNQPQTIETVHSWLC